MIRQRSSLWINREALERIESGHYGKVSCGNRSWKRLQAVPWPSLFEVQLIRSGLLIRTRVDTNYYA